jgi:NAD(P)-dependent dehydrogenase (short-subunit alcohol dehydrogenase family)
MRLRDRVAIVTGGSQGIGEAICRAYAREGARVAVVNARKPELGQAVARSILEAGGTARAFQCDVSRRGPVQTLVEQVTAGWGPVDILVSCAGVMINKPIEGYTEADWDLTVDTNMKGAFLMAQAVIPGMKVRRSGKIVFIASIAATHAFPNSVPYCASKAGVWAMTKALCAEVAKDGINVNSISPGNTATPLNVHLQRDPEFVRLMQSYTPTGRAYLTTDEVAGAAVFLASDEARAIHGVDLIVDDGWCAM